MDIFLNRIQLNGVFSLQKVFDITFNVQRLINCGTFLVSSYLFCNIPYTNTDLLLIFI